MLEATCYGCSVVFVPVLPEQAWCLDCRREGLSDDGRRADFVLWGREYLVRHAERMPESDPTWADRASTLHDPDDGPGALPLFGL